jgi:hypothetical protein
MTNENIYIRKIYKDNSTLKISIPSKFKLHGYNVKDFVRMELNSDDSITIKKLNLELN